MGASIRRLVTGFCLLALVAQAVPSSAAAPRTVTSRPASVDPRSTPAPFPLVTSSLDPARTLVAPDDTVYSILVTRPATGDASTSGLWIVALDANGVPRPGWPVAVDLPGFSGAALLPFGGLALVGNAESCAGEACTPVASWVVELDSAGRVRPGYPVRLDDVDRCGAPLVGVDGRAYVACGLPGEQTRILALGRDGRQAPGWPALVRAGTVTDLANCTGAFPPCPAAQLQFGSDGRVQAVALNRAASEARRVVIDADGTVHTGDPVVAPPGAAFALSPRGTGLSWTSGIRFETACGEIVSSEIRAFDPHGIVRGWPWVAHTVVSAPAIAPALAPALAPAIAPDGSVYVVVGPEGTRARIVALDRTGSLRPGWPATMPPDAVAEGAMWVPCSGGVPAAPTVGPDGTVYVVGKWAGAPDGDLTASIVLAYGPDGRARPGWPYRSSRPLAGGCAPPATPCGGAGRPVFATDGSVVLVTQSVSSNVRDRIVRLSPAGRHRPGWPVALPAGWKTTDIQAGPQGSLVVAGWSIGRVPGGEEVTDLAGVIVIDADGGIRFTTVVAARATTE